MPGGSAHDRSRHSQSVASQKPDYPIKPVPFTAVHLRDVFWAPRIEINHTVSIPSAFEQYWPLINRAPLAYGGSFACWSMLLANVSGCAPCALARLSR